MAITKLNSLAIPPNTIVESDLSYPLTNFSSTGIDDNASSTAITINSSQNVGIGTASPSSLLDVSTSGEVIGTVRSTSTSGARQATLRLNVQSTGGDDPAGKLQFTYGTGYTAAGSIEMSHTPNNMKFLTGTTERMRIDSSGNVGIGVTPAFTPGGSRKLLQIANSGNGAQIAMSNSSSESENPRIFSDSTSLGFATAATGGGVFQFYTAGTERMRIDSSGNLLVGTTSQIGTSRFSSVATGNNTPISGQNGATVTTVPLFNLYSNVGGTGTLRFQIQADGDAFNSNNSYGALSDERLKSNIVDASSQLDDIMAVQVRSYTLNATGDTHIGVVAQELEASGMSGLVKENQEGMKAVKYSVLYMKALKALQEAVTRIETLEAEVALLKGAN